MSKAWIIILLTIIWCGFSNSFTPGNIIFGALIAALCCWLLRDKQHSSTGIRPWQLLKLLGFTVVELFKSSFLVAWDVITPKPHRHPATLCIDLSCRTDAERTLLANLISLTPGTLSIDLSPDKTQLHVHVMFAEKPQDTINFIKHKLETKVMRVFHHANR